MAAPASGAAAKAASSPPQSQISKQESQIPTPLVGVGVSVAGALLIAYLAHRWSGKREARSRFAAASNAFRAAFAQDLAALETRSYSGSDPMDSLRIAHDERHAQAVVAFEAFLTPKRRPSFRDDWLRYCYGEADDGKPHTPETILMDHESLLCLEYTREHHLQNPDKARLLAIERIRRLLTYANET